MELNTRLRKPLVAFGIVGLCLVGVLAGSGAALASGALFSPAGVTSDPGLNPADMPAPDYPTNASGDSYGSLLDSNAPANDPDLILVEATNGKTGYVYGSALAEADGTTASESFKSPDEALAWSAAHAGQYVELPVFDSDGKTQIGVFALGEK